MKPIAILFSMLLSLVSCGRGYSDGERTGTVTKLSNKGLFCKTWEGELLMGGIRQTENGPAANVWTFTVTDPKWLEPLQKAQNIGERVTIGYVQWFAAPPCTSESGYEVTSVLESK